MVAEQRFALQALDNSQNIAFNHTFNKNDDLSQLLQQLDALLGTHQCQLIDSQQQLTVPVYSVNDLMLALQLCDDQPELLVELIALVKSGYAGNLCIANDFHFMSYICDYVDNQQLGEYLMMVYNGNAETDEQFDYAQYAQKLLDEQVFFVVANKVFQQVPFDVSYLSH